MLTKVTWLELAIELSAGVGRERFDAVIRVEKRIDKLVDLAANQFQDHVSRTVAVEQILAIAVDAFPLLVHHFVIIEQALADFVVAFLDLLLCRLDPPGDQLGLDRFAFFHPQSFHHAFDEIAGKDSHQVVFERQEESARTGVTLATATTAKLQVDPARFVPFGADHVQPADRANDLAFFTHLLAFVDFLDQRVPLVIGHFQTRRVFVLQLRPGHRLGVTAENDVGSATGHVGRDRHGIEPTGLCDDFGFATVLFGVQDVVRDAATFQQSGQPFAFFDADGSDQYRAAPAFDRRRSWTAESFRRSFRPSGRC